MVKIILELEDIERLITAKYNSTEIKGIPEDIEVVIKVDDIKPTSTPQQTIIRDSNGNIDADKSGLALKNREKTIPGGPMGKERGRLPVF